MEEIPDGGAARELARLRTVVAAHLTLLRRAQARLIRVELAARRRLERTLHDEAQQRLLAASAGIGLARLEADDGRRREILDRADDELRAALDELRTLARHLHPPVLARDGLAAAVHEVAVRSPVVVDADVAVGRLPEVLESAAYWLVCEALADAAEHSAARHARVRIALCDGGVRLEVVDDGVLRAGTGRQGITDLVRTLGGSVEIGVEPDGGTWVGVTLPR